MYLRGQILLPVPSFRGLSMIYFTPLSVSLDYFTMNIQRAIRSIIVGPPEGFDFSNPAAQMKHHIDSCIVHGTFQLAIVFDVL